MTDEASDRLIEWTGERCVPWADDIQVIYEHLHRYVLAAELSSGKRVLDLACGEGYGSALIAARAAEVVGVDIDGPTIAHARQRYPLPNARFEIGSMTDIGLLDAEPRFDLIVCFEAVEHVAEHDQLMKLVRDRLEPGGLFLSSTPDVAVYTHDHGNDNPYHLRELTEDEYRGWLAAAFENVAVLRQTVATGSLIHGGSGSGRAHTLRRTPATAAEWTAEPGAPHTYLLGVACDGPLPAMPDVGVLVDPDLTIVGQAATAERRRADALGETVAAVRAGLERSSAELAEAVRRDELHTAERDEALAEVDRLRWQRDQLMAELERTRRQVEHTAARLDWLSETTGRLNRTVSELTAENARLADGYSPAAQQLIGRYRQSIERYAPRGTRRRDAYERAFGRPTGVLPAGPDLGPVAVTTSDEPVVSVIVPTYGKWSYTRLCLASMQQHLPAVPFEVIVVDDCSPDDSAERVAGCPGVRLVRAGRNLGFVGACNLGAEQARGDLLMFLNNDTQVAPGWLDSLVDVLEGEPDVGLVGSKLVYPDGRLQECGGIIWADGTGWNYGRDADAADPEYQVSRDVDYCSGAAMLVRRRLFESVGGFDTRYAPAYYEDTDLAFAVRAAGARVVVQPASVVVHHEGVSHGTDVGSGVKRYQELNRELFVDKWRDALREQLPEASPANLWVARQRTADGHQGGLVLVADYQVPRVDEDSGSVRMHQVLQQLARLGHRVVFFPMNHVLPPKYTAPLQRLGITVIGDTGQQERFLREAGPRLRLAVLSRPQVACELVEQLRAAAPRCLIAYDTVDLHFLRLERQAELTAGLGNAADAATLRGRAAVLRELELALVRVTDVTFTVSPVERELLGELVPGAHVEVVSNVHEVDLLAASPHGRDGVLFVGSFDHPPNRDAATWLATEIMPLVWRRRPGTPLHIVGSNPPPEMRALAGDRVVVHGWVPDLEALYRQVRVVAAALRFGAGVKGKVGESLALGVPVVGTPLAFEGMHLVDEAHVLVGESTEEIADRLVRLIDDDELWARLSEAAKPVVARHLGPEAVRNTLSGLLAQDRTA